MTSGAGAWTRILDAVFPPRCVGCGQFGSFFCGDCLHGSPRADTGRCRTCWRVTSGQSCLGCVAFPPAFTGLRSAFVYAGPARQAVHALKFYGVSAAAPGMAVRMSEVLADWDVDVDAVVPVPLSGLRKRLRGYNQAELLAREVARTAGIPLLSGAVRRARSTKPQVKQRDRDSRLRNVESAFTPGKRRVSGNALLVDDVATTCSTLDACARALIDAGAARVYCLTFARED